MNLADLDRLRETVERLHGGQARFRESVPVVETFLDMPVWEGLVHVFDLWNHPAATTCYAWFFKTESGQLRRFAVLHQPPIESAADAVRAALVAEIRGRTPDRSE